MQSKQSQTSHQVHSQCPPLYHIAFDELLLREPFSKIKKEVFCYKLFIGNSATLSVGNMKSKNQVLYYFHYGNGTILQFFNGI